MELSTLTEPCAMTASLTSDESLHHRFNLLKKVNQQTKELNFSMFNQDKERLEHWLRNLDPHLSRCNTIKMKLPFRFSDKLMIHLSHVLYKLDRLRELKVNAVGSKYISNQGLMSLNQTLSKLQKLEKLKLDFSKCSKITNQAVINLGQSIYRLQHLTSLYLIFSVCEKITDDSIVKLGQRIAKLPRLTELKLIFSNCHEVSDLGVVSLSQGLSKLRLLTRLTFKFYRCSLTDESLVCLGENIPHLTKLKKVSLTVSSGEKNEYKGITPFGTNALSEGLSQLENLEAISLKFGWSDSLNDDALACMNKNLLKITKLTSLQLGIYYCKEITDSGVKSLTNNISNLSKLESLKINLWTCEKLTDETFLNLSLKASKLPNLKNFQLGSEIYGWLFFKDKNSILKFVTSLTMKKFGKYMIKHKHATFFIVGLLLLICLWALISRLWL
jgi:hypothetical protein